MKNYSRMTKYPESFIEEIEVNEDKINIKYTGAKKAYNKDLTDENLIFLDSRLKDQYILFSDNNNKLLKKYYRENIFSDTCLSLISATLLEVSKIYGVEIMASNVNVLNIILTLCLIYSIGTVAYNIIEFLKENNRYKKVQYFLNNPDIMNLTLEEVLNTIGILSKKGEERVKEESELVEEGYEEDMITAKLADSLSNRDLDTLVERAEIEKGLQHPVEAATKKIRTRKIKENKQIIDKKKD